VERGVQSLQWAASDRNLDALSFSVYYRLESDRTWKLLKQDLEDSFYTVNSDNFTDGTYIFKVVASDAPSNPPANALSGEFESRPFTIDNTPPSVKMWQLSIATARVQVAIDAADVTSTLNQADISVDAGPWQSIFPIDGITDSKAESYSFHSDVLSRGEHVLSFRIYDQNDNVGIGKLVVRIP